MNLKSCLWASLLFVVYVLLLSLRAGSALADTTPPTVTAEVDGTLGQNDWYTSTINVQLNAQDDESGVASITYQLDDDEPLITEFAAGENAVENSSFEQGWFWAIQKWFRRIESGWGWFWQSQTFSRTGCCSASIVNFSNGTGFWHNRNSGVWVTPGQTYQASIWAKTYIFAADSYVQMEVWQRGNGWAQDQLLAISSPLSGVADWTQLSASFTPQAGQDRVYLRLRMTAGGFLALAYFDDASLSSGMPAQLEFNVAENGQHSLQYWAQDGASNQSAVQSAGFKIDTAGPTGWQGFSAESAGPNTFIGRIQVQDSVSGLDVSEAEYAYYTDFENQGWDHDSNGETDWYSVTVVRRVSDSSPAGDGETSLVELETPAVDFGESSTFRFLFRATDMAGQLSQSQAETVQGPWVQTLGVDVYGRSGVQMFLPPPNGQTNADSLVLSGGGIANFTSSAGASLRNYTEAHAGQGLTELIPDYALLRQEAQAVPGGKTPNQDGVYLFEGGFVLDQHSKTGGYSHNSLVAVVIVEGDLRIRVSAPLDPSSAVVWLVQGNLWIEGVVGELGGHFLVSGSCDTNADRLGQNQLVWQGSLICLGNLTLARDLGEEGEPSNSQSPAEQIALPTRVFLDERLAQVLTQSEREYIFRQK